MRVLVIAADAPDLDLDALERLERHAHDGGRDAAHVFAVLVREDVVIGADIDHERGTTRRTALAIRDLDLLAAIDRAHVRTVIVSS
jgi:hypothetical protein